MATSRNTAKDFLHYPEAREGPDVPYHISRKSNPAIRGWYLLISALILEYMGFVRRIVWKNTGFANLRLIRKHIENVEPRFDPTVIPVINASPFASRDDPPVPVIQAPETKWKPEAKYHTVADYRAMYLSGELTPLAVAQAILPLIRRDLSPPGSHSIGFFDSKVELVIAAAKASTLRYAENRSLGPLDGVPVGVKDEYDIEGYTTSLGSKNDYTLEPYKGQSITAWCVKQLNEAGAITVGKVSMHEFGLDTSGNNPVKGTPPNPYNSRYYTGGSSSGCAYAVASGLVPIALGGDGGGSIRIPASFCSVFGLKPSHGRLLFKPCMNHSNTCAVNGPLASDIASLTAIYQVLGAQDSSSLFPAPSPTIFTPPTHTKKVLGIPEDWFKRSTPAVQRLCRSMIDRLVATHNYTLIPITIPFLPEGQIAHAMTVLTDAATLLPVTNNLTAANRIMIALGTVTPSTDYMLAQKLRNLLMQHMAHMWEKYPGMIIVTPTTSCAGWKMEGDGKHEMKYGINDGDTTLMTMEYVWMCNFLGLPGISAPAGFARPEGTKKNFLAKAKGDKRGGEGVAGDDIADGDIVEGMIPVGLMAMGDWGAEEDLLRWGVEAEGVGMKRRSRPPIWVDVVELAKNQM